MAKWKQNTLFDYTPTAEPKLTFYYLPLTGKQQDAFRSQFRHVESLLELATAAFCARTMMFRVVYPDKGPRFYVWPESLEDQTVLLDKISDSILLEVGTLVMGWKKDPDEDVAVFIDRVRTELQGDDPAEV